MCRNKKLNNLFIASRYCSRMLQGRVESINAEIPNKLRSLNSTRRSFSFFHLLFGILCVCL